MANPRGGYRGTLATVLSSFALVWAAASPAAEPQHFTLASTTSTQNSGLFEYLLPKFREATGVEARVVAVGTGQALALGRRGDADALLVHAPDAEKAFVAEGYGVDRRLVMYNDFVLVGPEGDPADVATAGSAAQAFERIAEARTPFASRGDDSGTHKKELTLWRSAGVEPSGRWYRELGSGMGVTLNTAAGMNAYTLTDRGTWISFNNRQELAILFEGDDALFNQYSTILVNPDRHDGLRTEPARAWHRWLVSPAGQSAIADYRVKGQQLFFPNAEQ